MESRGGAGERTGKAAGEINRRDAETRREKVAQASRLRNRAGKRSLTADGKEFTTMGAAGDKSSENKDGGKLISSLPLTMIDPGL